MSYTAEQIASQIKGTVVGDASVSIEGISNIEAPQPGSIVFAQDKRSLNKAEASEVACIIVTSDVTSSTKTLIQVEYPKLVWSQLLLLFHPEPETNVEISSQAVIDPTAVIGKNVSVGPFAVIGKNVEVGDNTVIDSHVTLQQDVKIGSGCTIHPSVTIYRRCIVGNNVILHAGVIVGADGFGYVMTPQGQLKVPQVGNVILEDGVEIGSSSTIDRATIGSTVISEGCKLDNLVQVGHNVHIGKHTVISAQTGISGSTKVGSFVTMGGKVGVADHVEIGDYVMVGAGAGIPTGKKIASKQIVFGEPARPYQEARKQIAAQLKSAQTYEDVKLLKKQLSELEEKLTSN